MTDPTRPDRLQQIRRTLEAEAAPTVQAYWADVKYLLEALARCEQDRDAWKDAIIDACVVDWVLTAEHQTNPQKAVSDLLWWQQKVALDRTRRESLPGTNGSSID